MTENINENKLNDKGLPPIIPLIKLIHESNKVKAEVSETKTSELKELTGTSKFEKSIENFFVKYRDKFIIIQLLMLVGLVALVVVPALLPLPSDSDTALTSFSLFARYMIWGLWFPLVFLSVIFFGRIWCGLLCPQGALTEWVSKWGFKKPIPRWMRYGSVPILSFIIVTILGQTLGVRDYALPAMEIFIGTTILSLLVGLLYAKDRRVWCRFLCPIGPLLGTLSRLGAVSFERKDKARGWQCPTFINTSTKTASSNCIECFKCTNPGEEGTLHLTLRRPGVEIENIDERDPNIWETIFIFAVAGLTLGAFHWTANPMYDDFKYFIGNFLLNLDSKLITSLIGVNGPWYTMVNFPQAGEVFNLLDVFSITIFMIISMFAVGGLLFALTAASAMLLKTPEPFMKKVTRLGYAYAPVALVSLVVGLGLILFNSFKGLGLSEPAIHSLQALVFIGGVLWSLHLARVLQNGIGPAIVPTIAGVTIITYAWFMVLF